MRRGLRFNNSVVPILVPIFIPIFAPIFVPIFVPILVPIIIDDDHDKDRDEDEADEERDKEQDEDEARREVGQGKQGRGAVTQRFPAFLGAPTPLRESLLVSGSKRPAETAGSRRIGGERRAGTWRQPSPRDVRRPMPGTTRQKSYFAKAMH